jgi:hypothetical protein
MTKAFLKTLRYQAQIHMDLTVIMMA